MDLNESWQRSVRAKAAEQRFGARDRLGTARLIDAAAKQRAAACVQSGRTLVVAALAGPGGTGRTVNPLLLL